LPPVDERISSERRLIDDPDVELESPIRRRVPTCRQKGTGEMARETRYRVIYFDENNKEVYNEDFHTFHDMLLEGQPLAPPPHVKRTEVWMTHLLFSTPES
jgi:hypothetical protein